jgi:glyoxylase-like metal-dependent hydrolase (beta-lactamase superfamily II)
MRQVWTRRRAGTAPRLVRSPVAERPQIHQIVLPLRPVPHRTMASVQAYLIEGEPLTLIDCGLATRESRAALESALDDLGHGLCEIERVVVTHAHPDHAGGIESLRRAGAALECWIHEDDAHAVEARDEVLRSRAEGTLQLFQEYGVPEPMLSRIHEARLTELERGRRDGESTSVERRLREGDRLDFKDFALVVRHSPGHTPGHILLEDEELGLLFTGDQVMGQAIPNTENHYLDDALPDPADLLQRRPRFQGLVEMRRSLRRLRRQRFRRLLPGYGGVLERPDRVIRDTLLFFDVRIHRIDRGLRHLAALGQDVTAFEIWKSLFPQDEPFDVMSDHLVLLIGALDCLEDEGKLESRRRADGVLVHHHL